MKVYRDTREDANAAAVQDDLYDILEHAMRTDKGSVPLKALRRTEEGNLLVITEKGRRYELQLWELL